MEMFISICAGIGLAAACGFRVFVPLLVVSVAALSGHLHLSGQFAWIGTYPALLAFSVATIVEIGGYYIPWLDHLLDTVATPTAIIAGTIIAASVFTDMSPFLRWTLAVIAGGGAAGLVQGGTVTTRALSTASSGGLGNPLVSTAELGLSLLTSVLAIVLPVLAVALLALFALWIGRKVWRRHRGSSIPQTAC
jgi:hypothetical protein